MANPFCAPFVSVSFENNVKILLTEQLFVWVFFVLFSPVLQYVSADTGIEPRAAINNRLQFVYYSIDDRTVDYRSL
jgi:hypothetical protein